jgi:hypothetical protein
MYCFRENSNFPFSNQKIITLISLHILMFKILENSCDIVVSFREESVLNKTGKIQSLSQWAIVYPP